jgi:uncharacterized protein YjbJ (UPF0337 family)
MGELKDRAKGAVNQVVGDAKQGSADPATREAGREQEMKGKVQDATGKIKGVFGNDV